MNEFERSVIVLLKQVAEAMAAYERKLEELYQKERELNMFAQRLDAQEKHLRKQTEAIDECVRKLRGVE